MLYMHTSMILCDHFAPRKPVQIFARSEKPQKHTFLQKHDFRFGQKLRQGRSHSAAPNHFPGPIDSSEAHCSHGLTHP